MDFGASIGPNRNFHILTGPSGAGKSRICALFSNRAYVLSWDVLTNWPERDIAILEATHQSKPVLVEAPSKAAKTLYRYPEITWNGYLIDDDFQTVVARRRERVDRSDRDYNESTFDKCLRRLRRMARAHKFHIGSDRSCEVELEGAMRAQGSHQTAPDAIFYAYEIREVDPAGNTLAVHYVGKGHDRLSSGYSRRQLQEGSDRIMPHLADRKAEVLARGNEWSLHYTVVPTEVDAFRLEERLYYQHLNAGQPLVNRRSGGGTGWTTLEETRRKMSQSAKRRASDPEWRRQHSEKLRGRKMNWSPEVAARRAANISASKLGSKQTAEHTANQSASRKRNGKKLTPEARAWLSNFHKTRPRGPRPLHLQEGEWYALRILRGQVEAPYPTERRDQLVHVTSDEKQALLQKRKAASEAASRVVVLDEFEWSRIQQLRRTAEPFDPDGIALTPAERVEVRKVRHYISRGLPVPVLRSYKPRRTCSAA